MKKSETSRRRKNREEKKKNQKKKENKKKSVRSLALVEHSTTRTTGVTKTHIHTCGLKVVVLGETTAILALVVVTTVVAEKKMRLPENNHNGTHTHTKVFPMPLQNAHIRERTLIEISRRFSSISNEFCFSVFVRQFAVLMLCLASSFSMRVVPSNLSVSPELTLTRTAVEILLLRFSFFFFYIFSSPIVYYFGSNFYSRTHVR